MLGRAAEVGVLEISGEGSSKDSRDKEAMAALAWKPSWLAPGRRQSLHEKMHLIEMTDRNLALPLVNAKLQTEGQVCLTEFQVFIFLQNLVNYHISSYRPGIKSHKAQKAPGLPSELSSTPRTVPGMRHPPCVLHYKSTRRQRACATCSVPVFPTVNVTVTKGNPSKHNLSKEDLCRFFFFFFEGSYLVS